jgi:hypothetical protein
MFVYIYSVFVLSYVSVAALRLADSASKEYYRLCVGLGKLKERPRPNKRALEPNEEDCSLRLQYILPVPHTRRGILFCNSFTSVVARASNDLL